VTIHTFVDGEGELAIMKDCLPGLPAHELGNVTIESLLLPDTEHWNPPQKAIGPQVDCLKAVIWIVGGLLPWVGLAILLVSG
jgi:hypothetical protein